MRFSTIVLISIIASISDATSLGVFDCDFKLCLPGLPENSDFTPNNPLHQVCCPKGLEIFCNFAIPPHETYCPKPAKKRRIFPFGFPCEPEMIVCISDKVPATSLNLQGIEPVSYIPNGCCSEGRQAYCIDKIKVPDTKTCEDHVTKN